MFVINSITFAQVFSNEQKSAEIRSVKTSAIEMISSYDAILNSKTSNYGELYSIFSERSAKVIQDILPENKLNSLTSIKKYINKSADHHKRQKVKVSINNLEIVNSDDGSYSLTANISKEIQATTRNGIKYIDKLNDLLVYIEVLRNYDIDNNVFYESKIDSIISLNKINTNYQVAYVVDVNDSIYDVGDCDLIVNKLPIQYEVDYIGEGNKYYFIKNLKKSKYNEYDLDNAPFCFGLTPVDKSRYRNHRSLKDIENRFLLEIKRPRFHFSPSFSSSKVNLLNSNSYGIINDKSVNQVNEVGFEIGYFLSYKPKPNYHYLSVSMGLYKMNLTSNFQLNNYIYSFYDIDPVGNEYLRRIKVNSLNEDQEVRFLNMPLSLKYGFNLKDKYKDLELIIYLCYLILYF